jgi:4-hydroxymandelate oxidase
VGRPLFWGLANGGESGVRTMLQIIREEFDRALAYVGCRNVSDINRGLVSLNSDFRTNVRV